MAKRRSAHRRGRAEDGAAVAPATRREFLSSCGALAVAAHERTTERQPTRVAQWPSPFPALRQDVNGHPLTYLDSGATTLRPQSVIDALVDYYSTDNANPAKVHRLAARAADRLTRARLALSKFVRAADPSEIIFVRGTTEGINLVASAWGGANLNKGDELVISIAEHYSNLLPWRRAAEHAGAVVRVADVDDEGRMTPDRLAALLSKRTRVVAFSQVSHTVVLRYYNYSL